MKKFLVFLGMGIIIVYYILSMKKVGNENSNNNIEGSVDAVKTLEDLIQTIESDYPTSPSEVVVLHNELMSVGYSFGIDNESVGTYIDAVRSLYSEGFKEINPVEKQTEAFGAEIRRNKEQSLEMISSHVQEVTLIKSEESGEEKEAEVTVKHDTNKGYVVRSYNVINEDGKWKIHGWDTKEEKDTVVTEE